MPVWLWWAIGGVVTYWLNINSQKQAALQSVDVGLLMVRSSTAQAAANAQSGSGTSSTTQQSASSSTGTTTIQSAAGPLIAESNLSAAAQQSATALSVSVLAP